MLQIPNEPIPPGQELDHEGQNPEDERRYRGAVRQIPSLRFVQSSSLARLLVHGSNHERISLARCLRPASYRPYRLGLEEG